MAENTHISWADHTFNAWEGCTKVSVGPEGACEGCYAEHLVDTRFGRAKWGNHPRRRTSPANWRKPLIWNREAAAAGTRPFVFANSLSDVFDNQVDPAWRRDLFELIRATPHLTWLLLTKRPQNIMRLSVDAMPVGLADLRAGHVDGFPRNAAIGCTVVTPAEADRDVPRLLSAKAVLKPAFAFLSLEPLQAAVDLRTLRASYPRNDKGGTVLWTLDALTGIHRAYYDEPRPRGRRRDPRIDWVITGPETDQGAHKARPSDLDWFRSLRDQSAACGIPFHLKWPTRAARPPADLQIQQRPRLPAMGGMNG